MPSGSFSHTMTSTSHFRPQAVPSWVSMENEQNADRQSIKLVATFAVDSWARKTVDPPPHLAESLTESNSRSSIDRWLRVFRWIETDAKVDLRTNGPKTNCPFCASNSSFQVLPTCILVSRIWGCLLSIWWFQLSNLPKKDLTLPIIISITSWTKHLWKNALVTTYSH